VTLSLYSGPYFCVEERRVSCKRETERVCQFAAQFAECIGCKGWLTYPLSSFSNAREDSPRLHGPDPVRQEAIQNEVQDTSRARVRLGGVPAKFPVCIEQGSRDGDGRIA
jgi:hypothetical protein